MKQARALDPIPRFQSYLKEHGVITEAGIKALVGTIKTELAEAVEYVDQAPYPAPEDALRHVYAE